MKITYGTTAALDHGNIFALMKTTIEAKTGKQLANIRWEYYEGNVSCTLVFCDETVELGQ